MRKRRSTPGSRPRARGGSRRSTASSRPWELGRGRRPRASPEHIYTDEGYSGSRLDRPGLDRLRDGVEDGAFEVVGVFSPDRLARKYAYQVLLLEELGRAGCEVVFVQQPISDDPNDQLLLQIQGAIAEYERAVLGERFRRGKLQKARAGHFIGGRAPYGYRYVPKQGRRARPPGGRRGRGRGGPDALPLADRRADDRPPDPQAPGRRPLASALGTSGWSARWCTTSSPTPSTPARPTPTATATCRPRSPGGRGPRSGENTCRQLRPQEEWIPIPVPAIIDQETHRLAQAQLARNAKLSFRNNTKHAYLLRCLLTCGSCGLAMYGVTYKATDTPARASLLQVPRQGPHPERPRTQVHPATGQGERTGGGGLGAHKGANERSRAAAEPVRGVRALHSENGDREEAEAKKFEAHLKRLSREQTRLVDAYQAGIIELEELQERRAKIAQRREALRTQCDQQAQLRRQSGPGREVLEDLKAFCGRIDARLDEATFEEKQAILQLLIERIIVGEDTLEIRHVIPLDGPPRSSRGSAAPPESGLRSDGVHPAPLPGGALQDRLDGALQAPVGVAGYQPHPAEAPGHQRAQERRPECPILAGTYVEAQDLPLAALAVHPDGDDHRHRDHPPVLAGFDVGGVEPHVGVGAFQRPVPEALDLLVELLAQLLTPGSWRCPSIPRAFTNSSTLRVETPWT